MFRALRLQDFVVSVLWFPGCVLRALELRGLMVNVEFFLSLGLGLKFRNLRVSGLGV